MNVEKFYCYCCTIGIYSAREKRCIFMYHQRCLPLWKQRQAYWFYIIVLFGFIRQYYAGACPGIRKARGAKYEGPFFLLFNFSRGGPAQKIAEKMIHSTKKVAKHRWNSLKFALMTFFFSIARGRPRPLAPPPWTRACYVLPFYIQLNDSCYSKKMLTQEHPKVLL